MVTFQELCAEILNIDSKIRFVCIWRDNQTTQVSRKGLSPLLEKSEIDQSVQNAVLRWDTRMAQEKRLGVPDFALTKYDQIYRITLPLTSNNLILVSTDIDCDVMELIHKIKIKKEYLKLDGFSSTNLI